MIQAFERRVAYALAGLMTLGSAAILALIGPEAHWIRIASLFLVVAAGALGAALVAGRRGLAGSLVLILGCWTGAAGGLVASGSSTAPISIVYPLLLFSSAWIGGALVVWIGVLTAAAFTVVTYLSVEGLLNVPGAPEPYQALAVQLVVLAGTSAVAYFAARTLRTHIEELSRSRRALRQSEERHRRMAALSSDWYWEQDAELRFVGTEGVQADRAGLSPAEHVGKRRWELRGTDIVGQTWEEHRQLLAERKPFRNVLLERTDDAGAVRYVSVAGEPIWNERQEFAGYRGIASDVTARILAAQEVQAADRRLDRAIEHLSEAVMVTDAEDRIVVANRAARELNSNCGPIAKGEFYADHIRRGLAVGNFPEAAGREEAWLAERLARRRQGGTSVVQRQKGRWLQISDQRLPEGGIITFALDITERKRAEDELRGNRRLLEQLIDAIPMSIFAKDLDSNYVMVNRFMAEFFGTTKAALLLQHTSALPSHDATREQSLRDDRWVYENRKALVHETTIQRPDGTAVPYHSSKIPLFDENGTLTGLLGINRDITGEREAQAALRASEQLFAAMFHDSPAPLAVVDPVSRRFQDVNRAFVRLFGYPREQVLGRTSAEFGAARSLDQRNRLYETLERDGLVENFELISHTAAGGRNISLVSGRVLDTGGKRVVVFSFSDITELSEAQRKIEEINASLEARVGERTAQLESANRELEAFSYSVSHDLRAPLRSIDSAVGLLNDKFGAQLPQGATPYLNRISRNAIQMAGLIEGLLEYARLSRQPLARRAIRPDEIVREVLLGHAEVIRERKVVVKLLPLPPCHADPLLFKQVFENLISNALKYAMHARPPLLEIGGGTDGGEAMFYVKDNGVGFDMAYANKLFGVFQRLHSAQQFEGTGIGLAFARGIVERHDGRIWAESLPGNGATFYFTIGARRP